MTFICIMSITIICHCCLLNQLYKYYCYTSNANKEFYLLTYGLRNDEINQSENVSYHRYLHDYHHCHCHRHHLLNKLVAFWYSTIQGTREIMLLKTTVTLINDSIISHFNKKDIGSFTTTMD
jgi:hypothetical protein